MDAKIERTSVETRAMARHQVLSKPKALFMLAAGMSFAMSVFLFFTGSREQGIFVGIWVPSILSAGALLLGRNGHE